ncbi:MAG TPA: hypothetical protein VIN08_03180 [Ohtaekwangia sp.]|uniref:hypothetical protein n=1 Tax=Ohtaekwangia sp. TaxID=2066019 RepID=UPI002F951A02
MDIHLKITGGLLILLALMHVVLPAYFHWKQELSTLSLINKQMMEVHTFFIAFTAFLMGILCLTLTTDLIHSSLGNFICLGLFAFWFVRLLFQFFVYSPKLWRNKKFETFIHILFIMLWSYFSAVFFLVYYYSI